MKPDRLRFYKVPRKRCRTAEESNYITSAGGYSPEKGTMIVRILRAYEQNCFRGDEIFKYSQFTLSDTVETSFLSSGRALFHTSHLKTAPSSSLVGAIERVAVVAWSLDPPFFRAATSGYMEPETKIRMLNCFADMILHYLFTYKGSVVPKQASK